MNYFNKDPEITAEEDENDYDINVKAESYEGNYQQDFESMEDL